MRHAPALFAISLAAMPLAGQAPPPPEGFEIGFEERIRSEDWDNVIDHDDRLADGRTQYRFRHRLWMQFNAQDLEIVAGLVNENRRITRPGTAVFNGREILFETLYLDYRFSPKVSLRAGRQNLMRGEGFILMDGTPGDGSRTAYFNALDLSFTLGASRLEVLAISNPLKDSYLPVLNKIEKLSEMNRLVEWDERALGLYYTVRGPRGLQGDAYAFYKTETDFDRTQKGIYQPDRVFTTLGGRLSRDLAGGWTLMGEGAFQWGREDGVAPGPTSRPIRAWGGTSRVKKAFPVPWKPSLSLGYTALSGQDPARTDRVGAWNPVFSRWPKWSELYIYSQAPEKGIAYWTNTGLWELELRAAPTPAVDLRATWYRLAALHPLALQEGPTFSTGKRRGDLLELRADWRIRPWLKTHAVYEHLAPGNAYRSRDGGHYLRFEVSFLWRKRM